MARKLPNVTIEREAHKYSLQSLFWGKFSLRVVIGPRTIDNPYTSSTTEWVIEIFKKEGDKETRVVPPGDDEAQSPYWCLSDGSTGVLDGEPFLSPYGTKLRYSLPSPRWTPALWRGLARQLAEELGYDAKNYSEGDLEPDDDAEDVLLRVSAEPCDPETKSQTA